MLHDDDWEAADAFARRIHTERPDAIKRADTRSQSCTFGSVAVMKPVNGLSVLLLLFLLTTICFSYPRDADPGLQGNEVDPMEPEFPADDAYWPKEGQDWMEGVPTARVEAPRHMVR